MAEGLDVQSDGAAAVNGSVTESTSPSRPGGDAALRQTVVFVILAAASAGIAYGIVRAMIAQQPADPTTERIQSLIDEANRLLKQLDDKKLG